MKLITNKLLLITLVIISISGYIVSCTKDDNLIVPIQTSKPVIIEHGDAVLLPGNMTAGNSNEWKFDKKNCRSS